MLRAPTCAVECTPALRTAGAGHGTRGRSASHDRVTGGLCPGCRPYPSPNAHIPAQATTLSVLFASGPRGAPVLVWRWMCDGALAEVSGAECPRRFVDTSSDKGFVETFGCGKFVIEQSSL